MDTYTVWLHCTSKMLRSIWRSRDLFMCCVFVAVVRPTVSAKIPEPEIVATEVISPSEIQIRWHDPDLGEKQKIKDKRSYSIKYYIHKKKGEKFERSGLKDTQTVIDSLHPNTTYVFRVKVIRGRRSSVWSKTAVNWTFPLDMYIQVEATTLTSSSIILAWTLPRRFISPSEMFRISWSEEDQDVKDISVKATVKSHVFQDLVPGRTYSFRLVSRADHPNFVSMPTVFARTYTDRPSKPPRDVKLKLIDPKLVRMTWSPPPVRKRHGEITQYKIQYKRRGSRRGDLCTVVTPHKPREYNLTDVEEGSTYRVRIAAQTVNGTGPYSKWDSIDIPPRTKGDRKSRMTSGKGKRKGSRKLADVFPTTQTTTKLSTTTTPSDTVYPDIPNNLHVFNVSSTSVGLRWSAPPAHSCCPIVAYRLQLRDVKGSSPERDIVTGTGTETVVDRLDPGTEYAVNISAFNTKGSSNQSSNIYISTSPVVTPKVEAKGDSVLVGGRANLTCDVTGDPIPSVNWYRDGMAAPYYEEQSLNLLVFRDADAQVMKRMFLTDRRTRAHLVLGSVTAEDAGQYTCTAHNSQMGTINKTVELRVHALPSFVKVEKRHAVAGRSTTMSCLVTGIPLPDVVWSRFADGVVFNKTRFHGSRMYVTTAVDEIKRIVNKTLHFSSLRLSDEGNYTCQASRGDYSTWRIVPLTLEVPVPPPVTNVRALAISPSRISILWEDPLNYNFPITAYNLVYRNDRSRRPVTVNTTQRHLEIGDLQPFKMYKVKVRAYNTHGVGEISPEIEVKTLPNTNLEPANVSAVALNSSIIQLDWEAPGTIDPMYIQGFNIYYRKENTSDQKKLFIAGNRNKQFLIGLGKEDTFSLRISTVLTWGEEAPSQWIKIRKNVLDRKPPPPPRRLGAMASADSIQLSWRQPLIPAGTRGPEVRIKGYKIRYGLVGMRTRLKEQVVSGRVMTYKLKHLAPGQMYKVYVRSFNEHGQSRAATIDAKTKDLRPGPVIGATATPMSSTEVLVQWLEPKRGPVTRYHVRYWRPGKRDKQSAWLYSPNTQYIAGSLRKHSQYRFDIIPYNNNQIGEAVIIHANTMIDLPDAPPKTVSMEAVNASSLRVTWDPPPKPFQNGPITGYKLVLKMKTGKRLASFSVDGTRRNYTFKNLEPSMTYKVRVAAMTVKGTGPSSKWVMQITDKIQLRAPESPAAMDTNVTSSTIYVTWEPPRDIGVPVLGYIVGYGRYIPEVYRQVLGPTVFNYTLTDLEADTGYIVSVRAYNHFGESLPKFVVGKTKQADPANLPIKFQLKMRAISLSVSEMQITWYSMTPDLQKHLDSSIYFRVRFSALDASEYQFINTSTIPITIGNLRKATKYEFSVKALRGNQETEWSLPVYNSTFHTVPAAPRNVTVTPDPSNYMTLTLSWMPPPDDEVDEYIVYSTTDPTLETNLWEVKGYPRSRDMMHIHKLMPHTTYYFHVQARNTVGYGPLSERVVYIPVSDPGSAPTNVHVHPLHGNKSTTVEVTWSSPDTPTGPITEYVVYYTSKDNISDADWMVKSEPSLSCLLIGLDYNATYRIIVRARYSGGGLGPASPVSIYKTLSYSDIEQRHRKLEVTSQIPPMSSSTVSPSPVHTERVHAKDQQGENISVDKKSGQTSDNTEEEQTTEMRGTTGISNGVLLSNIKKSLKIYPGTSEDYTLDRQRYTINNWLGQRGRKNRFTQLGNLAIGPETSRFASTEKITLFYKTSTVHQDIYSQTSTLSSSVQTDNTESASTATDTTTTGTSQLTTDSNQSSRHSLLMTSDTSSTTPDTSLQTTVPWTTGTESSLSSVSELQNSSHHTSTTSSLH